MLQNPQRNRKPGAAPLLSSHTLPAITLPPADTTLRTRNTFPHSHVTSLPFIPVRETPSVCAALKKRNRELEKKRLPRSQSVNRHIISIKVLVKEGRGNTDYAFHTYREKATGSLSHDKPQWQEAELKT